MPNHKAYYVGFSHCLGIGPIRFRQLISHFGDPVKAYQVKKEILQPLLGPALTEKFLQFRSRFTPDKTVDQIEQKGIEIVTQDDKDYPALLQQIPDPPICLYVKGNRKIFTPVGTNRDLSLPLAVVGTRKPTSYGLQATEKLVSELAQYGLTIVSGMAIGIDSAAHWSAINNKGPTIAVLGCGVDIIYPPSNKTLYAKIMETGGAVISEFPPGRTVVPGLFIARNRIIAGMSRGVLVIEGAQDSGALITARYAGEQGRDVFALPSPITSPLAAAPHLLLKQGAKMVTSAQDILEEYAITMKTAAKERLLENLNDVEKMIVEAVMREPLSADDLAELLKKPAQEILHTLSLLEIQNLISQNAEGKFFKR